MSDQCWAHEQLCGKRAWQREKIEQVVCMKKKDLQFLEAMVATPSVTGTEQAVASLVRKRLANVASSIDTDVMGSVHARVKAAAKPKRGQTVPTVMVAAHMDEIGLMVHYVSDEGFLSVSAVGGVDAGLLPGLRVDVHTSKGPIRGVVGRMPIHLVPADDRKQVAPIDKLCIDTGLPAEDVKKLVRIGDTITYGVGFEPFGKDCAVSRAFDDKAGVFVAMRVAEEVAAAHSAKVDYVCCATVQEEIGLRGGTTSAYGVNPDVAIAFDVTHATDYPGVEQAKFGKIELGGGPVIARGPNINPVVFDRLVAAAEACKIPYQIEAEPRVTGTDAGAMQIQRGGKAAGLVSLPLRYMHTPTEVINLSDVEGCIALLARFVCDLQPDTSFVPGE